MLFNQFHDLGAGSGIGVIYKDAQKDYDVVRWSTNEISAGALGAVDELVNTQSKAQSGIPVLVYNPLGWEQLAMCRCRCRLPVAGATGPGGDGCRRERQGNASPSRQQVDAKTGVANLTIHVAGVPALGYKLVRIATAQERRRREKEMSADSAGTVSLSEGPLRWW